MIELRPHHGMCIGQFIGNGYSEEFVENMKQTIAHLEASEDQRVKLVCRTDVICDKCPYNENDTCRSSQSVLDYDIACLRICGLEENQEISWGEFKNKVKENILNSNKLNEVCMDCQWIEICLQNAGKNY
jgi:hypothetical protein